MTDISKNLNRLRRNHPKKYTQAEVASLLGIEQNTYSKWESGINDVKSIHIPKIAEIFDVDIADLFKTDKKEGVNIKQIYNNNETAKGGNNIVLVLPDQTSVDKVVEALKGVVAPQPPKGEL